MLRDKLTRLFGVCNNISKSLYKECDTKTATDIAALSRAEAYHFISREVPLVFVQHKIQNITSYKCPALILNSTIKCSHSNLNAFISRSKLATISQNSPVIISDVPSIDYDLIRDVAQLINGKTIISDFPLNITSNIVHKGDLISFATEIALLTNKMVVCFDTQSDDSAAIKTNIIHIVLHNLPYLVFPWNYYMKNK